MENISVLLFIMLMFGFPSELKGANILLFPYAHGFNTQMEDMITMADVLQEAGHNISVLINEEDGKIFQQRCPSINIYYFVGPTAAEAPRYQDEAYRREMFTDESYGWRVLFKHMAISANKQLAFCQKLMEKKKLLRGLLEKNFDLFIVDFNEICGRILKYYFDFPTIAYSSHSYSLDNVLFPMLPSFIPTPLRGQVRGITFWDRVFNSLAMWNIPLVGGKIYGGFDEVMHKYKIGNGKDIDNAYVDSLVILMCHPSLDFPRPTFSNVKCMAGLNNWPYDPLQVDLESFMHSSHDAGVIVVSFGSILNRIEDRKAAMIAEALSKMSQKIIWRHRGKPYDNFDNYKNIKMMDWIPQVALLAHSKTKLFVTHCGSHSTIEAAIHAVPVIAVPVYLDQFDNAMRLVDRAGMGLLVEYHSLTEAKFGDAVRDVLFDNTYKHNAELTSSLLKDRPVPIHEEFLYYVNHVIKYRGVPRQTSEPIVSLGTVQLFSVDVIIFVFVMVVIFIICLLFACYMLVKGALELRKRQLLKKGM